MNAEARTPGQVLYEWRHPSMIRVVAYERRHFARPEDVFAVPNPAEPTPWRFLSAKTRASYETEALLHHATQHLFITRA